MSPPAGERDPRSTWLAAAGLLALALVVAREAVFEGRVFYLRDLHLQWHGQLATLRRVLSEGAWPLWDPLVAFGRPLLANANNQVAYPPTWLGLLLPPETWFTVFFVAHVTLAGLGVFRLARRYGASPAGAFVGAFTFTAGGPLLSLGNLWNHLAAAAWLPWALHASDELARGARTGAALRLGALLALPVLAGSPDVYVMAVTLVALDLAIRRGLPDQPAAPALASRFALALGISLGLSAVQFLPSLELARGRFEAAAAMRTYFALHPLHALQLLVPLPSDAPSLDAALRQRLFDGREPLLLSLYVGAGALALALAALASRVASSGRRRAFLVVAAAGALVVAFGPLGPLGDWPATLLPPLRLLRFPSKAALATGLMLALLAALGADAWRAAASSRRRFIALVAAPLLLLAALAAGLAGLAPETWSLARAAAPALLHLGLLAGLLALLAALAATRARLAPPALALVALVAALDPLAAHRDLNPTAPGDFYAWRPSFLPLLDAGGRTYVVDYSALPGRSQRLLGRPNASPPVPRGQARALWRAALAGRAYPTPPVLPGWGLADGYSRDLLGLHPRGLALLHALLLLRAEGTPAGTRLLRLGSVTRVVSLHTAGFDDLRLLAEAPSASLEPLRVWAVPDPLPRASIVPRARRLGDAATADALLAPDFDPTRDVLLGAEGRGPSGDGGAAGRAVIVAESADRVTIEAELDAPGWLLLTDTWDPGWRATVDGARVEIERANLAFRALRLPAGRHAVVFRYRPASALLGLGVSLATLLLLSARLVARRAARRSRPESAPAPAADVPPRSGEGRAG